MSLNPTTDINNLLEKVIAPTIQSQLFETNALLGKLKQNKGVTKLENTSFYVTVISQRNPSVVFMGAGSTNVPTGTANITAQVQIPAAYGYGVLRLDDRTIEATKSDKGALGRVVEIYGEQLKNDLQKDMNRQAFRDGTGKIAKDTSGSSGTTVTVDTTEYIVPGMLILDVTAGTNRTVVSVTSATTFTVDSAWTVSTNDVFAKYDSAAQAVEMNGLDAIVDDGTNAATFQTITRSSNPWWKAFVDTTTTALTEADMINAFLSAKKFASQDDPYVIIMGQALYQKYGGLLTQVSGSPKRINQPENNGKYVGGWGELAFMTTDVPVMVDYDCPAGEVFFLNLNTLTVCQLTPVGFMPSPNGVLTKVTGTTLWEALLRFYGNIGALKCRPNAVLRNRS